MNTPASRPGEHLDSEYEDLLGQWSDLEAALSIVLAEPALVPDFPLRLRQCDRWLQDLIAHDNDAALYLIFQLASTSTAGYSASHALVCATLCHILAQELALPASERQSLVRAALTMNIGMTALQDQLALQREPLTPEQKQAIQRHPQVGVAILMRQQIIDDLWLTVIEQHHQQLPDNGPLAQQPAHERLTRILGTIDRYAAMISPRKFRTGKSTTESVRAIMGQDLQKSGDEVGLALVRSVGLCPPGTFVRLDNGETAVVLRRSQRTNAPQVARLLDPQGQELGQPVLHDTQRGRPQVQSALARASVSERLSQRTLARIGLYATRRRPSIAR